MSDRTNIQENVQPFQFYVADDVLEAITERVATYPWHEMPNDGGWDYGTNMDYLKELCAYWVNEFDWRAQEKRLNSFSHFIAPIDDIKMHFIYEQGSGDAPMPLMISHGWPGSVAEFLTSSNLWHILNGLVETPETRLLLSPRLCPGLGSLDVLPGHMDQERWRR